MDRRTYSELLKSWIDISSLFKKGNKQSEPSPALGTPTLISESLASSLQSPRPSLKDAAPEDRDVSFSACNTPGSVCSWWLHGPPVCSARDIFFCPKVDSKVSKVLFRGIDRKAWKEQACLGLSSGCRMETFMETRSGCTSEFLDACGSHWYENSSIYCSYILLALVVPRFPYSSRRLMEDILRLSPPVITLNQLHMLECSVTAGDWW